jgi:uncharacterized protein YbaP (TraB family)
VKFLRPLGALLALLSSSTVSADPAAWRVTTPSGGEVVLLGSIHLLREQDYPLPRSIDAYYEASDRIVLELDLDDLDPADIQSELFRVALLPTGTRLNDVLAPKLYKAAEAQASELGIELALLDGFEPWLVALTMLDLGMSQLGYRSDRGVEQYLLGRAKSDRKEVLGLESLATQTAVFDSLTIDEQSALLEQTLGELESAERVLDEMIVAWRAGELDTLSESLMSDFSDFPELYESLVVNRNNAWIAKIEQLLESGLRYLVVVGGLHLVGDDSVVELLRAGGHEVLRIDP